MTSAGERTDVDAIAREAMEVLGTGRQVAPFSTRHVLDLGGAYRVAAAIRQLREAGGEKAVGRKIGFTNRTIWPQYGVYAPIWGYLYDTTVHDLADLRDAFSLVAFAEPLIEPEVVFGLAATPDARMDERELQSCIGWVAHGFEIVHSIFPGWKFSAADTAAGFGMHGALLIGERHSLADDPKEWLRTLPNFDIVLRRDGEVVDRGHASNVLDGPLSALRHVVGLLASDGSNPALGAGEIVTTGTLTRAIPIRANEHWATTLSGVPLAGIDIRFG
jgi:2-oxo-3-hexenedioate decarboxylase